MPTSFIGSADDLTPFDLSPAEINIYGDFACACVMSLIDVGILDRGDNDVFVWVFELSKALADVMDVQYTREFVNAIYECFTREELSGILKQYVQPILMKETIYMSGRLYGSDNPECYCSGPKNILTKSSFSTVVDLITSWLRQAPPLRRSTFLLRLLAYLNRKWKSGVLNEIKFGDLFISESDGYRRSSKEVNFDQEKHPFATRAQLLSKLLPAHIALKIETLTKDFKAEDISKLGQRSNGRVTSLKVDSASKCNTSGRSGTENLLSCSSPYRKLLDASWNILSKSFQEAYDHLALSRVLLEERNVYCNAYNVLVLHERSHTDPLCKRRVIHTDANQYWLAHCEGTPYKRRIRFINIGAASTDERNVTRHSTTDNFSHLDKLWLTGHAGSVRALWLDTKCGCLLSGSYDTSIRLWNLKQEEKNNGSSGAASNPLSFRSNRSRCIRIYRGHAATVLCLWVDVTERWPWFSRGTRKTNILSNGGGRRGIRSSKPRIEDFTLRFASGAADCLCCVWRLDMRDPLWIMQHRKPVTAVVLRNFICVSGDASGTIKLWHLVDSRPRLVKILRGHTAAITALRIDEIHVVSASKDALVRIWSLVGDLQACLGVLPHPGEVLCIELCYLRVITGCSDGRIRIWNLLTQHCQRVMFGNYRHDPIISIQALDNRLLVNTQHNVLAFDFEPVAWNYGQSMAARAEVPWSTSPVNTGPTDLVAHRSHAEARWNRARIVRSADPRLLREAARDLTPPRSELISEGGTKPHSTTSFHSAHFIDRKRVCSSSEGYKSRPYSAVFTGNKLHSVNPRQRELLITPPIPGSFAARHRKGERPKSEYAVSRILRSLERQKSQTEGENLRTMSPTEHQSGKTLEQAGGMPDVCVFEEPVVGRPAHRWSIAASILHPSRNRDEDETRRLEETKMCLLQKLLMKHSKPSALASLEDLIADRNVPRLREAQPFVTPSVPDGCNQDLRNTKKADDSLPKSKKKCISIAPPHREDYGVPTKPLPSEIQIMRSQTVFEKVMRCERSAPASPERRSMR
ncbi:unnamed protein product [Calicophoron daubneyi]|uniref:Uncharacterized protein n=1 Tax=Calicophoron daubneyi TaxID=300641 RepID=A0AAV2T0P4_CALDB